MALKDIIKSISEDATQQVAAVKQESEKQIAQIKERWTEEATKQRQAIKQRWQQDTERKVNQSALKLKAAAQNKVLMEKQWIIDEVLAKSLEKLGTLPDVEYVEFLVAQIKNLPKSEGNLSSTNGKSALLKKALNQANLKYKVNSQEVDGQGGFVFETDQYSVDGRFEHLLELKNDELRVVLGAILFNVNKEE